MEMLNTGPGFLPRQNVIFARLLRVQIEAAAKGRAWVSITRLSAAQRTASRGHRASLSEKTDSHAHIISYSGNSSLASARTSRYGAKLNDSAGLPPDESVHPLSQPPGGGLRRRLPNGTA